MGAFHFWAVKSGIVKIFDPERNPSNLWELPREQRFSPEALGSAQPGQALKDFRHGVRCSGTCNVEAKGFECRFAEASVPLEQQP